MGNIVLAAGFITELAAAVVVVWKLAGWLKRIIESERCQLRSSMLRTYYHCKDNRQIRQYERENFDKSFAAYKALNGNSFIDDIYNEVRDFEIIS